MSPNDPDRRRHKRIEVSLLIQYRFDTLEDFLAEYSIDISQSGIFLHTDNPCQVGSMIYLQFYLRESDRLIEGLGQVVRVTKATSEEDKAGMGVEFVDFDKKSMDLIQQITKNL
jgi:uncharacterized protein (TIGR02266 family)